MVAPATSPSSEDRATWPSSKPEAKPLQSASGMGSPGMPVSARGCQGAWGQEHRGCRPRPEAWGHRGEPARTPALRGLRFTPEGPTLLG